MLEKPDLKDQLIIDRVQSEYGYHATRLTFLPLGADVNTAVYRLDTEQETPCFLRLRKGAFNEVSVALPQFLKAHGIQSIIAPLETMDQQIWVCFGDYKMILYPYIEGENGYEVKLSDRQWLDFGVALKGIHTAQVSPAIRKLIKKETYSPRWREIVKTFMRQVEDQEFNDPVAVKLAAFMQAKRDVINHLVERAGQLGLALQTRSLELVLCHSDIHPGNLLIGRNGALYIVDWDEPIFAPKERDLMFIGGIAESDQERARQAALFYQGYGRTEVDLMALAYYRYERIVQDIAAFCEQLLLTDAGGDDRQQSYLYFIGQFLPNQEVEIACKTDNLFMDSMT